MVHNRQTQPQAAILPRRPLVALSKALKNVGQKLVRNSNAVVADNQLDMRIYALQQNLHAAVLGRELHGIAEQVPEDLLKPVRIAGDRSCRGVEQRLEMDVLGIRSRPDYVERRLDDLDQLEGAVVEPQLSRHDAGNIEQVADELVFRFRIPFKRVP